MFARTCKQILTIAAAVATTLAASVAVAQNAPEAAATAPVGAGGHDFRRGYDLSGWARSPDEFGRQAPLDWPGAEFREVAYARARAVITRYDAMRAREAVGRHIDALWRRFEASPEFAAARRAEDDAWAEYQSAVASALGRLASNPDYAAAVQLAGELKGQIDDARFAATAAAGEGSGVAPAVYELATVRLSYARRATEMRSAALASDAAVAEARVKLAAAADNLRQLRARHDAKVRDDQDVHALREHLWETRTAAVAAAAYEDSARLARRGAYYYARYLHRNHASPYYGNTYGGYGDPWISPYDPGLAAPVGGYGFKRR